MGFTIIEVLISLLLLALLLRLGNAGLSSFVTASRSASALQMIHDTIALARSRAVLERTTVTVCGTLDGQTCVRNWNQGVLVFTDSNNNGELDGSDRIIATPTMRVSEGEIRWRAFQNRRVLQISSVGHTRSQNGSFTYCHYSGDTRRTRQLVVSRTARLRFAQDNDGDGVVDDSNGKPVKCP